MGATVVETRWGTWPALRLEDDILAVTMVARVGGRVVSLLDRRTGREWLTQGEPPDPSALARWGREDAVLGGPESFGWDECLPSVIGGADPLDPAAPPLRDHGDQWGRSCALTVDRSTGGVRMSWSSPRWPMVLERRLALVADGGLRADYTLASRSERPLPILWSAHPVLWLEPGSRVELEGIGATRVVGVIGWPFAPGPQVPWPEPVAGLDLSRVRPVDEGAAVKLFAATTRARVTTPDGASLDVETDGDAVRTLGVWLDAGGWPQEGSPVHQVALEPTSSAHDRVTDAVADGCAWTLPPGGSLRWWMTIRIRARPG